MMRKKLQIGVYLSVWIIMTVILAGAPFYFSKDQLLWLTSVFVLVMVWGCVTYLCLEHTPIGKDVLCYIRGVILSFRCQCKTRKIRVGKNVRVSHPNNITFGKNIEIMQEAVFAPLYKNNKKFPSKIIVGNNVHFGVQDRIASACSVTIEDDVLFAAFVHVTDHSHEFHDISRPVIAQGVYSKGPVRIKRGAWLGFGCHILSGVTIGEGSVVGANAVVTRDVPDHCAVAGNPARIISYYDFEEKVWKSVH